MPKYIETEEDYKIDNRPCSRIKEDLKDCLVNSDCMKVKRKTAKECILTKDDGVPQSCMNIYQLFFLCKRSILDNRQRFRGRKGY